MANWGWGVIALAVLGPVPFQEPTPAPPAAPQAAEKLSPAELKSRERAVLLVVQTVLMAERTYAAANGSYFDVPRCLARPWECIPAYPGDGASFLDPTYDWLEPHLGHVPRFHPGPQPSPEELGRDKASRTSLKAYAFTITPLRPGETGLRAFCGDSRGRLCVEEKGHEPPVKNGLCEPCKKLE